MITGSARRLSSRLRSSTEDGSDGLTSSGASKLQATSDRGPTKSSTPSSPGKPRAVQFSSFVFTPISSSRCRASCQSMSLSSRPGLILSRKVSGLRTTPPISGGPRLRPSGKLMSKAHRFTLNPKSIAMSAAGATNAMGAAEKMTILVGFHTVWFLFVHSAWWTGWNFQYLPNVRFGKTEREPLHTQRTAVFPRSVQNSATVALITKGLSYAFSINR